MGAGPVSRLWAAGMPPKASEPELIRAAGGALSAQEFKPYFHKERYDFMKLKVTLLKSTIGCKPDQVATVKALGRRKIRSTVVKQDNPAMRGMIFKVKHLVGVEEVED